MRSILVFLMFTCLGAQAEEAPVKSQEFTVKIVDMRTVTEVHKENVVLPSDDMVEVSFQSIKCSIDATVYNPSEAYSFLDLVLTDGTNRASSGGYVATEDPVTQIFLNEYWCLVMPAN